MAIELKSKITSSLDLIKLHDLTGEYSTPLNEGGYYAPNIDPENVASAYVTVTNPEGDVFVLPIYNGTPPVVSIPSNVSTDYFPITPDLLGLEKLTMGYYEFVYTVVYSDGDVEIVEDSKSCYFYYAPVECCIEKKVASIDLCSNPQDIQEIMTVRGLFTGMQANAKIGNKKESLSILNYLKTKCDCCC